MANQSIKENVACSRLVSIVERRTVVAQTVHKHIKDIVLLDKLRLDLPPKQYERCLPGLEIIDHVILPNNFFTPQQDCRW
jgi:hypothetical protein